MWLSDKYFIVDGDHSQSDYQAVKSPCTRSSHILHSVRRLAATTRRSAADGVDAWKEGNPVEELTGNDTTNGHGR